MSWFDLTFTFIWRDTCAQLLLKSFFLFLRELGFFPTHVSWHLKHVLRPLWLTVLLFLPPEGVSTARPSRTLTRRSTYIKVTHRRHSAYVLFNWTTLALSGVLMCVHSKPQMKPIKWSGKKKTVLKLMYLQPHAPNTSLSSHQHFLFASRKNFTLTSSVFIGVGHSDMKSKEGREARSGEKKGGGGVEVPEEGGVACSTMEIKNRWSVVARMN